MINHARSLLLNCSSVGRPALGQYGEEYIPADYRVLAFTQPMQALRSAMLGSAEEPLFQNYRLAQLMACLHAVPQTLDFCLTLDRRFTYRPFDAAFSQFDQAAVVEPVNEFTMLCGVDGSALTDETSGRAVYRYRLETATGPVLRVFDFLTGVTVEHDLVITGMVTEPVRLNAQLTAVLNIPIGSWREGAQWLVTAIATPQADLSGVMLQLSGLPAALAALSQTASTSFVQLWKYGVAVVEQLAGATAMVVEAAERIRRG